MSIDMDFESVDHCLITGLPIKGKIKGIQEDNQRIYLYHVDLENGEKVIFLCSALYKELRNPNNEISQLVAENRSMLIWDFINNHPLWDKFFHSNTCIIKYSTRHIKLSDFINETKKSIIWPKSRKEKYDNLVSYLYKSQSFEGAEIEMKSTLEFYGNLCFVSFDELKFFLRELQRKDMITYNETTNIVQFTFAGLETVDTFNTATKLNIPMTNASQYEIGLSFAGEDRAYVEQVASKLLELKISVFYDKYEQVNLWGKDLYQHLNDVYKNKCRYCVIFISRYYAEKLWTKHELRSAQTRAFNENREYILPARFDDTEVPGLNSTIGYLDCKQIIPEQIALLAAEKLKQ